MSDSEIFNAAVKLPTGERAAFLDRACGADRNFRGEVESLLQAHEASVSFLREPPDRTAVYEPSAERAGTIIGEYKLIEQIGEGGMGTVWMAQQTEPVKRLVAVKVIKPGMDSRQVIARFEAERQALALMEHPNIARVLDGGTTPSARPYFVMDLVKGVPITRYCDEHHLTPRQRLELFIPVCLAIQHAHQKGIIHRDLKPSNVLVAMYDGKPVPKVIDFGVAKAAGQSLTEKTLVTGFGNIVGTLEYMSPEQAEINQLDIDTRSDIYSLGVLLYELLTGSTPFSKKDLEQAGILEMLRVIREQEPSKPSTKLSTAEGLPTLAANRGTEPAKLTRLVRGELDWIVMKALEKDRSRRYETANGFAMDVQRYLADEPVQACPPSTWYRFRKLARRRRRALIPVTAVALAAVVGVSALAVSTVLVWQANRDLKASLEREEQDTYFHLINLAHGEISRDNLGRAQAHLDQCPGKLQQWEWRYLKRLCKVEPLVLRHNTEVNSPTFSPDGEWIAAALGDGTIKVWNIRTRTESVSFSTGADLVFSVAFHPKGQYLASTGAFKGADGKVNAKVQVWEWATGHKEEFECPSGATHNRGTAYGVAFSPDGRRLAVGHDGAVTVWDWEARQLVFGPLRGHTNKGICVAFSRDGGRLASGSWDGDIRIWDARTGELLHHLSKHHHCVSALAFSPDGGQLVSASFDRSLIVWDATTGQPLRTLEVRDALVLGVAFSPDGSRIASAGEDKTVRVWEAATGREILELRGHAEPTQAVVFSPDGDRLASASTDGTIRVWDATPLGGNEDQEAFTFPNGPLEVWTVGISHDGQSIAWGGLGADPTAKVRDVKSGGMKFDFPDHGIVFCLAWHPRDYRIASSGWDVARKGFTVKVWDARTGAVDFELPESPVSLETHAVAWHPDGKYFVTGGVNGTVQVWDVEARREVGKVGPPGPHVKGLAFSRDGKDLASVNFDGVVNVWEWDVNRLGEKEKPRHTFRCRRVPQAGMTLAFSPDGRRLAAGGVKQTVQIWNLQTGEEKSLEGHTGDVWVTVFSPDPKGRWIASAGEDSTVKVWDSESKELTHNFRGHTGLVTSLVFSRDGRQLFSGSRDKTVKVWNLNLPGDRPVR